MGIGSKLQKLLDDNNTNANELAKKINVSPQTIYSTIKRDSKKADIEVLLRIANIFGVKAEYFVEDNEDDSATIAAHFDGTEYTAEQLARIKAFAAFIKTEGRASADATKSV